LKDSGSYQTLQLPPEALNPAIQVLVPNDVFQRGVVQNGDEKQHGFTEQPLSNSLLKEEEIAVRSVEDVESRELRGQCHAAAVLGVQDVLLQNAEVMVVLLREELVLLLLFLFLVHQELDCHLIGAHINVLAELLLFKPFYDSLILKVLPQ